tara:strand:- start:26254 stop:26631 length:378 start_codon:yes stop_codon:yes gene_type:complete
MQNAKTGKTCVHERVSDAIKKFYEIESKMPNRGNVDFNKQEWKCEHGISYKAMALAIDHFNELNSNWMHIREPEKGKKFIAIYNDDSGCIMCKRNDNGVYWADVNDEPYQVSEEWFDNCGRWVLY